MNKEKFEELIEKYKEGKSTLLEEQILSDNTEDLASASLPWFKFIQINKSKAPKGLKDSIWESIKKKRVIKRRLTVGVISAAASIMLLISISVYSPWKKKQSNKKKEALLTEALSMFDNAENKANVEQIPIYEDDMVIIYASAE